MVLVSFIVLLYILYRMLAKAISNDEPKTSWGIYLTLIIAFIIGILRVKYNFVGIDWLGAIGWMIIRPFCILIAIHRHNTFNIRISKKASVFFVIFFIGLGWDMFQNLVGHYIPCFNVGNIIILTFLSFYLLQYLDRTVRKLFFLQSSDEIRRNRSRKIWIIKLITSIILSTFFLQKVHIFEGFEIIIIGSIMFIIDYVIEHYPYNLKNRMHYNKPN